MLKPPIVVASSVVSFVLLLVGQTGGKELLSVPNVANLTAVAVIGYILIHLVCKTLPAFMRFLMDTQADRAVVEDRHRKERVLERKEFLTALQNLDDRSQERSEKWQVTISEMVRHCEFKNAEK